MSIEPEYYVPVIPTVLINGAEGIGTGWSTSIPQFNPIDVIENIERKLANPEAEFKRMIPWSRGFQGSILPSVESPGSYTVKGVWRKIDSHTVRVTELPLKRWTSDYKQMIETLMQAGEVADMKEFHQDNTVDFHIKFSEPISVVDVEKRLKLVSSISANNYVLFDQKQKIKRYSNECEILREFFDLRLEFYSKRKENQLRALRKEMCILENKSRFITEINNGSLRI